ncbi:hypothetical protein THIOM_005290 [Candidatus Thiomargarita nelsonii]|uniref:Uncharacterized protein n=1 Tax=Candidatus Thiomargarita nelsonii TaxID=1003181 RepID=A0A176RTL4_9GAMM|nr:hypothetical protein THIOM_005290 [Candidatus Thiomargarita nelsonii]
MNGRIINIINFKLRDSRCSKNFGQLSTLLIKKHCRFGTGIRIANCFKRGRVFQPCTAQYIGMNEPDQNGLFLL